MRVSFIPALLLASVASVSAGLNLNDLDPLSTKDVTPGCLSAYSQEIDECPSAADFKAKKTCSSDCIDAINARQETVILACRQAFVYPDSLLRRLLDGGLAITLCPAIKSSSAVSTPASTSASSVPASSAPAVSIATKTEASTVTPTTDSFSGFLTLTISSPASSITNIPSELTLDGSAEPTVDSVSAYALSSDVSSVSSTSVETPTSSAFETPLQSGSANSTSGPNDASGAGSMKATWASIMIGFSVALGVTLL